jgi:mono/diheme cytochrome c family protein
VVKPLTAEQQARFEQGRAVYSTVCAACHQPSGQGLEGVAPPLLDSEWVLGSPQRLVRIVLQGVAGPITVNGAAYKGEMPGLSTLGDVDIAAALTYVRREWDHASEPIDEATVAKVRAETTDRAEMWTAAELLELK